MIVEATDDLARVQAGIDQLFARPNSAAYLVNALHATAEGLGRREPPRPVVVGVTTTGLDLSDRNRGSSWTACVSWARPCMQSWCGARTGDTGVPSFLGENTGPTTFGRLRWTRDRDRPGGSGSTLRRRTVLDEVLSRLALALLHQYQVAYTSPDVAVELRTVQVGVRRGERVTVHRADPGR